MGTLIKLAVLVIRNINQGLVCKIKSTAKKQPLFRRYICRPPAQLYHWVEDNAKKRMLNLGKPIEVSELNESKEIELGANILGEVMIFSVAAFVILLYSRHSREKKEKEYAKRLGILKNDIRALKHDIEALNFDALKDNSENVRKIMMQLQRMHYVLEDKIQKVDQEKCKENVS